MRRDSNVQSSSQSQATRRRAAAAEILITRGLASIRERLIESDVFTLGSGADCDLILGDDQFPELYAYILFTQGEYRIRCLTAEPVLTLNAEDTVAARLSDGDRLRCGPYEFRFHQFAASPNRPAAPAAAPPVSAAARWVATDGQSSEGVAAVRRLMYDIQARVDSSCRKTTQHRRSA